ncbi:MAG: methylated-DNA--[protein]-cysteine S-methyltransferase [Gemmatimonas sp.]
MTDTIELLDDETEAAMRSDSHDDDYLERSTQDSGNRVSANKETGLWYIDVPSPIGTLTIASDGDAITGLYMESHRHGPVDRSVWKHDDERTIAVLQMAHEQLDEYFAGTRTRFTVPLVAEGTAVQKSVWAELSAIPFGETRTYGDIARIIGNPKASRAVGAANGRNPISIIVPCHRVIGSNGALTGFGGGIERKQWLLAHQARVRAEAATDLAQLG